MQVNIRLFAALREAVGAPSIQLSLPAAATVETALQTLDAQWPQLELHSGIAYAVNQSYVAATTALHDGDELALIPPVSGG